MNTKFLKQSFVLLLISAILAVISIRYVSRPKEQNYGGDAIFTQTLKNINSLGRLTIENKGKTVNLQLEDNLWRVMEMGNYYAGYNQINNLFNDFTEAKIYRRKGISTPEEEAKFGLNKDALRIITRDNQNQILNDILIGNETSNGLYHFAKIFPEKDVFLISGKLNYPKQIYSWLQQPILSFSPREINQLTIDGVTASRKSPLLNFTVKGTTKYADIESYLGALVYVAAYDVRRFDDFDEKIWPKQKNLQIITFDGLVSDIKIYGNETEYWISIKISATRLPKTSVNDYINDNAFLYDGWYFKLENSIGENLLNAFIVQ